MSLFRRSAPETGRNGDDEAVAHRLTLDLSKAERLATMMANSRASRVVEIADLLAGMYIYNWERLCKYWNNDDQERIEELLRKICRISPARWNAWLQLYDKQRQNEGQRFGSLSFLRKLQSAPKPDPPLQRSAELTAILKQAEEISPFHDSSSGREIPILTSECVLLCIVRNRKSEISRKLAASGLNVPQLERDALSSRRLRRE